MTEQWFDWLDAVPIDEKQVMNWVDEVEGMLDTMEYTFIRSGNTMVVGFKDETTSEKEIFITRNIRSKIINV